MTKADMAITGSEVAIIGMAGRFPGAPSLDVFWKNLREGVESIKFFSVEELVAAKVPPPLLQSPNYVPACGALEDMACFDAGFFGFSPRDAAIMDPQHRLFLECAWESLEHAGYTPESCRGPVGVFAGSGMTSYLMFNLLSNPRLMESVGEFLVRHTGNDKDFLATRVSYEFNLTGPSVNVQTACSTSLVAVHMAAQSLLNGECETALAGGVTIVYPQDRGYLYKENEILSPDGHCRPFDAKSKGTVFGSGVGVVVLKRLESALADGDSIHAVIKGSAINNDGSGKVGYLAPSVEGQARAIAEAIGVSGVEADTISFVETHGTGTPVGDPIEMTALTQAFRQHTDRNGFCSVGSLKSNIGHLDTAAGVAGLIKTVLAMQNREIPPTLHYQSPNPEIDFVNSPFYVGKQLTEWRTANGMPRRAGVSSLGVGGTNAHVVLEEAPAQEPADHSREWQLLLLSHKTASGLEKATDDLLAHLKSATSATLADVAYTLQLGRRSFPHRRSFVCRDSSDAIDVLERFRKERLITSHTDKGTPSIVFMFPGGGAQYARMGFGLYQAEPVYREVIDECAQFINPVLGLDLRSLMFPGAESVESATRRLEAPSLALPALFSTEYALARLLISWGVQPAAMIGHSMGEYVAACLAGVITFQDGLSLVAKRGSLFETLPSGGMLSVSLPESEVRASMVPGLSIAAINAPELCVVSGPAAAITQMEELLKSREVDCTRIHISVAAHSAMLDPILSEFEAFCRKIEFKSPKMRYISNLTGKWMDDSATRPDYWVSHLRNSVRFGCGLETLLQEDSDRLFLEIGPGRTLSSLSRQQTLPPRAAISTLRHPQEPGADGAFLLNTVGKLWGNGASIDWKQFYANERRRRVPLPTYAFERQRFWIEPGKPVSSAEQGGTSLSKRQDITDWFSVPTWKRTLLQPSKTAEKLVWMVIGDPRNLGDDLMRRFADHTIVWVAAGNRYAKLRPGSYRINPGERSHYDRLIQDLREESTLPNKVVHLLSMECEKNYPLNDGSLSRIQTYNFDSLLFLAQALGALDQPVDLFVISSHMQAVAGEPLSQPHKALLLGPCRVIPHEFPNVRVRSIDVVPPLNKTWQRSRLIDQLSQELVADSEDTIIAYRGSDRWVQGFDPIAIKSSLNPRQWVQPGGVFLITGGLGGIGLELAEWLAKEPNVKLVLVGRTRLPNKSEWEAWVSAHAPSDENSRKIKRIQKLESLGAGVLTLSADVTDLAQMKEVIRKTRQTFGAIRGVFHAAGTMDDGLILMKSAEAVSRVIRPKLQGTLVLDLALKNEPLDFLVLFSSVSSILGLPGQVDYCAANAFLDAFSHFRGRDTQTQVFSINWNAWREVGMTANLVQETGTHSQPQGTEESGTGHPFLERRFVCGNQTIFSSCMEEANCWLLFEHVIKGVSVIPGSGYLELARAAFQQGSKGHPIEIREVYFLAPFAVAKGEARELRLKLTQFADESEFSIQADSESGHCVTGKISLIAPEAPRQVGIEEILARCNQQTVRVFENTLVTFGPRWNCVNRISFGKGEALAKLELPAEFAADLGECLLHPALLDVATGCGQALIPGFDSGRHAYVPFSYGGIRLHHAIPSTIYSHVRLHDSSGPDLAVFSATLIDEKGCVVAEVSDFVMKRIDNADAFLVRPKSSDVPQESVELTQRDPNQSGSVPPALEAALQQGILNAEGMEALDRILSSRIGPQIIASSVDIDEWLRHVHEQAHAKRGEGAEDSRAETRFSRPALSSDFCAPRNEVEELLCKLWEELLGIDRVGVQDNFFELGGHSLIAVRVFTRIKKTYKVNLGLAVLFEAPTVEKCAALIRAELGDSAELEPRSQETGPGTRSARKEPGAEWPCLVPIKPNGTRPPFFCIHGMGGNILEYLHLTNYLHPDQPFFGIQAQGLDGKRPILTQVEEIAAKYVEEICSFQPEGPYYLGGSSFGGLVGYEMAQQFQARNQKVALLALFDSFGPGYPMLLPKVTVFRNKLNHFWYRLNLHSSNLMLLEFKLWPAYFMEKVETFRQRIRKRLKKLPNKVRTTTRMLLLPKAVRIQLKLTGEDGSGVDLRGIELPKVIGQIQNATTRAAQKYVPRPYSGDVTLFRATHQRPGIYPDRTNGWGKVVTGRLEIHDIPGHHGAIVREPRVKHLAQVLNSCLEQAQTAEVVRHAESCSEVTVSQTA